MSSFVQKHRRINISCRDHVSLVSKNYDGGNSRAECRFLNYALVAFRGKKSICWGNKSPYSAVDVGVHKLGPNTAMPSRNQARHHLAGMKCAERNFYYKNSPFTYKHRRIARTKHQWPVRLDADWYLSQKRHTSSAATYPWRRASCLHTASNKNRKLCLPAQKPEYFLVSNAQHKTAPTDNERKRLVEHFYLQCAQLPPFPSSNVW